VHVLKKFLTNFLKFSIIVLTKIERTTMTNVINFPTEQQKRNNLKKKLNYLITEMEDQYKDMEALMQDFYAMEDEVARIEAEYETILKEYARNIDLADMEARFLSYSNLTQAVWCGDSKTIQFGLGDLLKDDDE